MPLTNTALVVIADALIGGGEFNPFNAQHAHLGVGNGTQGFAPNQTDLQGTSKIRKPMDGGFPTRNGNILTFRATYGTSEANFDWREWGIFNAASGGQMLNRKVENLGTKTSTATWQFTVDLEFVHGA